MNTRRYRLLLQVSLAASLMFQDPCILGQTPNNKTPPAGTLQVQVHEVVLDVVVTDRQGNFVNGLTQQDFTILEDKVKQKIVYFQPPSAHAVSVSALEVHSSADLEKIGDAPVTILVLDELNTQFADMAYARGALQKWLDRQPAKLAQPTALMVASDERFTEIHDYTQDRDALLLALKQHFPSYPYRMLKGGNVGPDAGVRMAMSLGTLMQIAQASSGTPGRKNVVWVGVGFPSLVLDDVSPNKEDEIVNAAERTTAILLKSRVTLNVIDPTAMESSSLDLSNPEYLNQSTFMEFQAPTSATVSGILNFDTFAPATGGVLYSGRNDVDREIETAIENGSNYYTLSYSPTNQNRDPAKFRNIRIVMRNPDLTATTRTGYFPAMQLQPGQPPSAPTVKQLAFDLTNAGLSSMTYNGLKVQASKSLGGYVLHVDSAAIDPHVLSNGHRMAEVTVMRVCFGKKNRVLSHDAFELESPLPPQIDPSSNISFTVPPDRIPSGTQRMRFVVRDALSGHIGTIDIMNP